MPPRFADRTGIDQRRYTSRSLEEIALEAAARALSHAGREPEEIGAVLFCSCTNTRLIPAVSACLTGQLGMHQTHNSCDFTAACAGMPYGFTEAIRLLQEVERPVLLVCAEKFSDKIGTVRPSRMIFGDGLAVYGPEVKSLAGRNLRQMIEENRCPAGPHRRRDVPVGEHRPHRAAPGQQDDGDRLAVKAGLSADQLYFNIEKVGTLSAASIPMALHDAVRDGVVAAPTRVFATGFGGGAVGGYAVLRLDPDVVSITAADPMPDSTSLDSVAPEPGRSMPDTAATSEHPSDDVRQAFPG